jgi:hypothetical protein
MPGSEDDDDDRLPRMPAPKSERNVARPQFAQRPQGAALNRKPAMAAANTADASEVERELRELLRHVR